jgi:16S rRNA processing protein RimM
LQLVVARIGRAHGIRGEVTIELRTDNPAERFEVGRIFKTEPERFAPLKIASIRNHNGTLLLSFEGREDRNAIEELRNVLLIADVDIPIPSPEDDEFHATLLIGCRVFTEDGLELGEVVDILQLPTQDTLVVKRDGKEILVPFVKKHVPDVDVKEKRIVVREMEGLI